MNKLKTMIVGALAVAGAWCAEAAEAVTYLEPVFGKKYGETTGFEEKTIADYTLHETQDVGEETWNAGWHVVSGEVKIDTALWVNGDVKIILKDGATLTVNKSNNNNGGLRVEGDERLTVYTQSTGEETMGKIVANGGENGSAIGSRGDTKNSRHSGYITINGGKIEANGGNNAAGIGGGRNGDGRRITINGGIVTAKCVKDGGAGIGGSYRKHCGYDITINGGTVTATGGYKSAGIGGGDDSEGYDITINGGTVTATGGKWAAGIGGGLNHDGHDITINGGTVTATGGGHAAGIGGARVDYGGRHVNGYNIFIHGGTVTATGSYGAAGIGGGDATGYFRWGDDGGGRGHDIWITGGIVKATGGNNGKKMCGAGIGGGVDGDGYEIHITGGKVDAYSEYGAAIGGSAGRYGYDIFISGGTVIAKVGDEANSEAIGMGARDAYGYNKGDILFYGGSIMKKGGKVYNQVKNAAGQNVYKVTVTGLTESPDAVTGLANFGGIDIYPDDDGKAYLYLPKGTYSFRSGTKTYSGTVKTDGNATFNPQSGGDAYGVTVDGTDVSAGSGEGWAYSGKVLTLSQAKNYTLAGENLSGLVRVKVTANAAVTLDKLQLGCLQNDCAIEIAAGATDAKLTLVGDSSLTAYDAAIGVANGAKLTLDGTGALVGGRDSYVRCHGVNVAAGGTFVMNGGTIRKYEYPTDGGAIYNAGTFTMNGGTIRDCAAKYGAAFCNVGTATVYGGTFGVSSATTGGDLVYAHSGSCRVYGGCFKKCNGKIFDCVSSSFALYGGVTQGFVTQFSKTGNLYMETANLYVYGTNPKTYNGWLSEGTFTFDPAKAEYEAAGLKLVPGTVAVPQGTTPEKYVLNLGATGVTVNGVSITAGSGTGWTFANSTLTLSNAMDYLVKGLSESPIFIDVTADAHVTLKNFGSVWDKPSKDVISIFAQNATLTLEGANQIYTKNTRAAIGIASDAKLTLDGSGDLVGGKAENVSAFCVWVEPSGTFVMNGGTIRNYTAGNGGAVHIYSGTMTMNGGTIAGCIATGKGGAVYNDHGTFTMNGGTISACSGADGGAVYNIGSLTIMGGAIKDSYAKWYGGAIADASGCYTYIYGGTFKGNAAGVASPFLDSFEQEVTGYLYGGVWTGKNPMDDYGMALKDGATVTQVGDNYIVGKDVKQDADAQLLGGTYTFDPSAAEYKAADVALVSGYAAKPQGTTPETYEVCMAPAGFTINGTDLCALSGSGWTYDGASRLLALSGAGPFTLTGDGSAVGFGVQVDSGSSTVVLSNATITASEHAPLAVNAKDVKVKLIGENTLEMAVLDGYPPSEASFAQQSGYSGVSALPALAVPSGKSVTIDVGDGYATTNAWLTAIGGEGALAIGGEGDVTIAGGTINTQGGINGANVAIKGGIVAAVGASGLSGIGDKDANVTISGGSVVAQGDGVADIDGNVVISGGSVQANLVTNPRNANDTAVFCVTVPDVTNVTQGASISGITGAEDWFADNYGQKEIYPLDGALYLWMPNGYYEKFYVGEDKQPYCAQVSDEPTVAYRLKLDLYVNGEQVAGVGGTGWSYDWDESHLTLSPGEGSTNRYVITGTATDGAVSSIIVEGSCDVTAADLLLGVDGEDPLEENLLQIGNGDDKCTVNLTITGASAFMVATRGEIAPLGVKANATLNFRGSATIRKWDINVEDGGRVTMEDPKTLTFVSEDDAKAAADIIKPLADTSVFPEIDQVAYAALFDVSYVEGAVEGTWTLDYQFTDETIQAIATSLTDAEETLAENLARGDPSTTISDCIPGIYYALASAPSERVLAATSPLGWSAAQEEETTVTGATYAGTAMAYYQLRATWRPGEAQEIDGTVMVPPDVGVTVDGTDVKNGEGEGWTFSGGFLTLTNAQNCVVAGANTKDNVRVFVTANATVTLDNLTLVNSSSSDVITFETAADDAKLVLAGDNTVYSKDNKAGVYLHSGAKVTLAGEGALVGGKSAGVGSRGVYVCADATFVMNGGTIRDYATTDNAGAIYNKGSLTINGGTISGNAAAYGGALYNFGKVYVYGGSFTDNEAKGAANSNGGFCHDGNDADCHTYIYGGSFSGNKAPSGYCQLFVAYGYKQSGSLFGGVFSADPMSSGESKGCLVLQGDAKVQEVSTEESSNFVVGKDIAVNGNDQLTAGTYTFCPTNAQYEAVELFVEPGTLVTKKATTPATWVLGVECPDYLAGYGYAVTNTFKKWAKAYPPGDPDGIYKNAFLLNVAQDREAEALAAFKIGSFSITNEVVGTVTNTVVAVEVAKPIDGAKMFNGDTWLQCATNGLSEADFLDIEDGRYTEAEKSFIIQRIDFEHKLTPEAFPAEPTGTKTMRVKVVE